MPPVDTGVVCRGAAADAAADDLGRLAKRSSRRSNSKIVDHVDSPGRDVVGLNHMDSPGWDVVGLTAAWGLVGHSAAAPGFL